MVNKDQMKVLLEGRKEAYAKLKTLDKTIECLRDICKHDWVPNGYDSHKDHYKCSICSATDSW